MKRMCDLLRKGMRWAEMRGVAGGESNTAVDRAGVAAHSSTTQKKPLEIQR